MFASSRPDRSHLAVPALVAGAIGIAFAPVLAKLAVMADGTAGGEPFSPVAVAFWRMLLAAPIFALAAWVRTPRAAGIRAVREGGLKLLLPGLFFALDLGLWHWSFEYTSVANSTIEANFAVVLVPLAGWLWFGERFGALFLVGASLAFFGMVQLVGASFSAGGQAWFGDLLGLGVAVAYTGYQLSTKRAVATIPVNLLMAVTCASCAAFLAIGGALTPGRMMPATTEGWALVFGLALVSQVLGQGLITFGLRTLPASFASVVLILQPVGAALLGWIFLAQPLTTTQMMAGLLVLVGIFLARRGSQGGAPKEPVPVVGEPTSRARG